MWITDVDLTSNLSTVSKIGHFNCMVTYTQLLSSGTRNQVSPGESPRCYVLKVPLSFSPKRPVDPLT